MIKTLLVFVFACCFSLLFAQQKTVNSQFVSFNTLTISKKWNEKITSSLQLQARMFSDVKGKAQFIAIANTSYQKDNKKFGIGFVYFDFHRPPSQGAPFLDVPEYRPYQSLDVSNKYNRFTLINRLMIEERFQQKVVANELTSDFMFSFRFRFKWELKYLIWESEKKNKLGLSVSEEPFINFGKEIVQNTFDQNRLLGFFSYDMASGLGMNAGYMNWIVQSSKGGIFDQRHSLFLGMSYKL